MYLASKVEHTPVLLSKIVIRAYETIYLKDPDTACQIHQKNVFEKQKTIILIGEKLLLSTIQFDFNIQHPYRALVHALEKFRITQKDMIQVAWNFVNDALHTTLCLQYKPHCIAAASLLLAAKLYKVKLPRENGYVWWHEFDIMPQQLHAAVLEMMDLMGYLSRPAMTRVLEKPTATIPTTTLVAKEEPSCSRKSGVLSRLGSLRSSWNQSSQGGIGGQKPIGIIVPSSTSNLNPDGQQHTLMTGRIEGMDFAMRKPEEAARNEFSQGSNVDQARVKPEQAVGLLHKKDVDRIKILMMRRKLERESNKKIKDMDDLCREISLHFGDGMDQASSNTKPVANCESAQGSGQGVNHVREKCGQFEDVHCKIDVDRIKALRMKRKLEREYNKRSEAKDDSVDS